MLPNLALLFLHTDPVVRGTSVRTRIVLPYVWTSSRFLQMYSGTTKVCLHLHPKSTSGYSGESIHSCFLLLA